MRRKVTGALAAALLFYGWSDVMLWQRVFEAHDLYQFDAQYQTGHLVILVGLMAVGMLLLWDCGAWALWYGAALYSLNFGGVEDILYYWLDGRGLPKALPWLDIGHNILLFHPATGWSLLASAGIWVGWWGLVMALGPGLGKAAAGRVRKLAAGRA